MTSLQTFEAAKTKVKAAMEEAKKVMKNAFSEETKRLFQEHSVLVQFAWTQYTPYFNDGIESVFGVGEPGIWFVDSEADDPDSDLSDSVYDHEFSTWKLRDKPKSELTPNEVAGLSVLEFLKIFEESDFKEMFGDHTQVTVNRDGVTTEEYSHD